MIKKLPTSAPFGVQDDWRSKINEVIDVVNQLVLCEQARTCYELIHKNETLADPYAEQRKWIGKLCRFWDDDDPNDYNFDELKEITPDGNYVEENGFIYENCEPVKPDDDVIYQELTPEYLRNLMATPKCWKEQDPETVRKIEEGFRKLYCDKEE